ncbi:motility protein A [Nitratidesulfovibrio vulgaris]|jgi:chemotaxis protein MotA|uniref:MotA/TolQ/ExbB proton channel n=1 Tax=Nitratidesulfovibrio vulgaris (strain DP4) TaxID=391774 RepID=A0A0H3AC51_NITV4|nr:motility protein A [Nitratidesulfovibrio vulgaris]ABM29922.1 MotA/TolQ/ExbB proton channel [Nitratidesulfovibrio vulgaris DP4]WCB46800.1 motility protein A [Nitratidesulfovibrio vulgaris]GEB81385.1 chemotaxis protein MotA [Desulfovibrio desulfuricans]
MDLATLIGLAVSFGLIALALLLGGDPLLFADLPALLIVLGGTIGATLVNYPIDEALRMLAIARHAFKGHQTSSEEVLNQFLDLSNRARREGLLALEPAVRTLPDPFMRKGLQLTVDGLEPEAIEDILRCEMENMETRHESGAAIFAAMGAYAPALGLIGTVIGLVQMLKRMNDPSTIGPAMSVALITTFYGAVLANLVFLPLVGKLRHRSRQEIQLMEMQLAGILAIARGENPRIIREKLVSFQTPAERHAE